jgi:hypothetical protein
MDIPPFYGSKILVLSDDKKLVFAGLCIAKESHKESTFSFLNIDREIFKVEDHQYIYLKPKTTQDFFGENKQMEEEFVQPLSLLEIKKGVYSASWNYFFQLDQYKDAANSYGRNALIAGMTIAFGLVGGLATVAATSGENIPSFNKSIWLEYDSNKKITTESVLVSDLNLRSYSLNSFGEFKYNQSGWGIMNRPVIDDKNFFVPCVFNYRDSTLTSDSKFDLLFLREKINLLYPGSVFSYKNKYYFLGAYDPDNEPSNIKSHNNVYTNILIEIE